MARKLLQVGESLVGRAIVDDHQFNVTAVAVTTDARYAAFQVVPAVVCQQVHRELKEIG